MTRAAIRELKRQVRAGLRQGATEAQLNLARESAVLLLQRSIAMKHDRLSLRRLADSLKLGAAVDAGAWEHCSSLARDPVRFATLLKTHPCLSTLVQEMAGHA